MAPIVLIPLQPHLDAVSDETDKIVVLELLSSAMKLFFKVPHCELFIKANLLYTAVAFLFTYPLDKIRWFIPPSFVRFVRFVWGAVFLVCASSSFLHSMFD